MNYASRSDMQRDRARERMERARRQWELEHADLEQQSTGVTSNSVESAIPGHGPPNNASTVNTVNSSSMNNANTATPAARSLSNELIEGGPGYALVRKTTLAQILCPEPFFHLLAHFLGYLLFL